jgi:uridine phosphorylase
MENSSTAKKMMHIGVRIGEVGRYVFLPGKVERAALIAEHFDNPRKLAQNREFVTYTGELEGTPVAVTSTGIGGPSTGIAVEELFECGADTMMRIGSCASTSKLSRIGDVIIPKAAVRMEGTGDHYLPVEFPALPDYRLFRALELAAKESGFPYNTGVTITKDSFYTEVSPETKPVYQELKYKWEAYEKGGATNTCMECSLLFLAGASLKIRAAAVLICGTNYKAYSNDFGDYPENWEDRAVIVGIEAMRAVIRRDREQEGAK